MLIAAALQCHHKYSHEEEPCNPTTTNEMGISTMDL